MRELDEWREEVGKNQNKYPYIKITWGDHWIDYGDHDEDHILDNIKDPYIGEYIGFLVGQSHRMIAIASNVWDDGTMSDVMYIMKSAIIKKELLGEVNV